MTIDGRLKEQSFTNQYSRRIYIHKYSKDNYSIGINGTSKHYSKLTKRECEIALSILTFYKD